MTKLKVFFFSFKGLDCEIRLGPKKMAGKIGTTSC